MNQELTLFQAHNVIFLAPIGIALVLWLLSLLGAGHDADSGHWDSDWHLTDFHWIDLGKIPLSLIITLVLFTFGSMGLGIEAGLGYIWQPTNLWFLSGLAAVLAFLPAIFLSAFISRKLQPLFQDYGKATLARELIGSAAVVTSSNVTENFGAIRVTQKNGYEIELAARNISTTPITSGKKVVIASFDEEKNLYFVSEIEND